jgi:microcystin-dependent protein
MHGQDAQSVARQQRLGKIRITGKSDTTEQRKIDFPGRQLTGSISCTLRYRPFRPARHVNDCDIMKTRPTRRFAIFALAAASCSWSGTGQACSPEAYISEVCVMATNFAPRYYYMANGQRVPIRSNQALLAMMGFTFGGSMQSGFFQLPDLRGRMILGAGQRLDSNGQPVGSAYAFGQNGGHEAAALSAANLPPAITATSTVTVATPATAVAVDLSMVTANASTLALPATTFSAPASGLALKASPASGGGNLAAGNALGTPNTPNLKLYVDATPNVTMRAGSIAGTLNGTIPAATGPTALTGDLAIGLPARGVSTTATPALPGGSRLFGVMPPYQAMNYYIAAEGYFPMRD